MAAPGDVIQDRVQELSARLHQIAQTEWDRIYRSHRLEYQILRWCIETPSLRNPIFRFIDCLPALSGSRDVVRHLGEYLPPGERMLPPALRVSLAAASGTRWVSSGAFASATRRVATQIARLFIAGPTLEESADRLQKLLNRGLRLTVDPLGELTVSQAEADDYQQTILEMVRRWDSLLPCPIHLSIKLSSLAYPFDPIDTDGVWKQILRRTPPIFQAIFG